VITENANFHVVNEYVDANQLEGAGLKRCCHSGKKPFAANGGVSCRLPSLTAAGCGKATVRIVVSRVGVRLVLWMFHICILQLMCFTATARRCCWRDCKSKASDQRNTKRGAALDVVCFSVYSIGNRQSASEGREEWWAAWKPPRCVIDQIARKDW
jgi:hypothetical protein